MHCPACASDNIQRQRLVYEGGTSHGTTTSRGRVSSSSRSGRGRIRLTSKTTTQTPLAKKCSPPTQPNFGWILIVPMSLFLAYVVTSILSFLGNLFLPIAAIVGWGLAKWRDLKYQPEMKQYQELLSVYEQSWICHKCGNMWSEVD